MNKTLLSVLAGMERQPPPIWLMRQAGRYLPEYRKLRADAGSFLDLCYSPGLATEVTLQPVERFGLDAAILFSDILVVPHGLGQAVGFEEGRGPVLDPVRDAAGVDRLRLDGLLERLAPVYETVTRVADRLGKTTALIGFAGAPWTVATYMVEGGSSRDFSAVKRLCYAEPAVFARLVDVLVEGTVAHLTRQVEAGAEVVQIFESHAGVLPSDAFERWVIDPVARIVGRLRERWPALPIIGFPRGAGALYPAFAERTGVTAVSLDTTVPLAWAQQVLPARMPIQGNLDPVLLLLGGAAMQRGVERVLREARGRPHVFNLGHGVDKDTRPESVRDLVALVRSGV